jgi:hypothetical protein
MIFTKWLAAFAFVGSVVWFSSTPDYEPAIACATSLIALIAIFRRGKKTIAREGQTQAVAENGIGIQAGKDVKVGRINIKRD